MNLRQAKKLYNHTKNKYLHYKAKSVLSKHHALGFICIPESILDDEMFIAELDAFVAYLDTMWNKFHLSVGVPKELQQNKSHSASRYTLMSDLQI